MTKKLAAGGLISPANLWGKPLPTTKQPPTKSATKKVAGKMTDPDDVMDDEEIDVDAELAEEDAKENELSAIEAENDSEITDETDSEEVDDEENEDDDAEDGEPDYEDDDGDDESQDAVEDDEEKVVTAVADEETENTGEAISKTSEVNAAMAEKMSLSDHVRAEIARRHKAGESLRGKDIVDALAKRKLTVSPAQVSQLLKKAGLGGKSRGRPATATTPSADGEKTRAALRGKKKETAAPAEQPSRQAAKRPGTAGNGFKVPMGQLQAAEAFVEACGGSFKSAAQILTAAEQLSQTFGG